MYRYLDQGIPKAEAMQMTRQVHCYSISWETGLMV